MWSALASAIDLYELLALVAILMAACLVVAILIRKAPRELRVPLTIFNAFYLGTTVIGATLLASPSVRLFWMLMLPSMDASWLDVWDEPTYWLLLWAPLVIVNGVAILAARYSAPMAIAVRRTFALRIDPVSYTLVGLLMLGYCYANLATRGYLGAGLFESVLAGDYRGNIQLRAAMMAALGDMHYGLVYMGVPAISVLALADAIASRRRAAWASFSVLSAALTFLFAATMTKGSLVVFGLALVVTTVVTGFVKARYIPLALIGGIALLTLMGGLLSGSGLFEVVRTLTDVVFRMASGIPFYVAMFPAQIPFVGLDLGLGALGLGPQIPVNLVVANMMFPGDTWVQGAVPAPAHFVGYAEGGVWWSLFTLVGVGGLISIVGGFLAGARSAVAVAVAVGGCVAVYYTTQTGLVGAFLHSYGLKWWIGALAATVIAQKLLELATGCMEDKAAGVRSRRELATDER